MLCKHEVVGSIPSGSTIRRDGAARRTGRGERSARAGFSMILIRCNLSVSPEARFLASAWRQGKAVTADADSPFSLSFDPSPSDI